LDYLASCVIGTGGNWQIIIDSMTLLHEGQYLINTSSAIVQLSTIGVYAMDAAGLEDTFSASTIDGDLAASLSTVDPSLATHVHIDFTPPVVTFNSSPASRIAGTITDDFELGTLTINIQDLTDPASSYFNGDPNSRDPFNSSVPLEVNIPIGSGTSSPWQYDDTILQAGHTYLITATAVDSVNNSTTTTFGFGLPPALLTNASAMYPAQNESLNWGNEESAIIQYSDENYDPSSCAQLVNDSGEAHHFTVDSQNGDVYPTIDPSRPDCGVAVNIVANLTQCQFFDTIRVYDNGQIIGSLLVQILIPNGEEVVSSSEDPITWGYVDPFTRQFTQNWHYLIQLTGRTSGMVLNTSPYAAYETLNVKPLVYGGVTLPPCESALPVATQGFPVLNNLITDNYGFTNVITYPIVDNFFSLTGTHSTYCGEDDRQHYHVYACEVPVYPIAIDVQKSIAHPEFLSVLRTETYDPNTP
jgi:hypothetical protein